MATMSNDDCSCFFTPVGLIIFFIGALCMVVIGGIAVHDYNETRGYEERSCSGFNVYTSINDGTIVSCAKALTCVISDTEKLVSNPTCLYQVELYYPPITCNIGGKNLDEASTWATDVSNNKNYKCLIDDPPSLEELSLNKTIPQRKGVTSRFNKIVGYGFMLAVGLFIIAFYIIILIYFIKDDVFGNGGFCIEERTPQTNRGSTMV